MKEMLSNFSQSEKMLISETFGDGGDCSYIYYDLLTSNKETFLKDFLVILKQFFRIIGKSGRNVSSSLQATLHLMVY